MRVHSVEARSAADLERAVSAAARDHAEALLVARDGTLFLGRARIVELAARSRLPTMYGLRERVEAGGLMSYGVDFRDVFRRAAHYIDKILKLLLRADQIIE